MLQPQAKTGKTGNLRGSVNDLEAELEKGLSMADALSRASLNKEILDLKVSFWLSRHPLRTLTRGRASLRALSSAVAQRT